MDNSIDMASPIEVSGLSVNLQREWQFGSLRYFDAAGPFAAEVRGRLGGPLPKRLHAVTYPADASRGELILAWRSPTETLLLTADGAAFAAIAAGLANKPTGCLVDQSGGLWAWQVTGERTRDLLQRLGSTASIPVLGEARVSRLAELPVMALCVHEGQILLLVERVYSEHLYGWMRATAADF